MKRKAIKKPLIRKGKKEKVGRPTKLTPVIQAEIVKCLKAGNYIETAANLVGLPSTTVRDWIRKGVNSHSSLYVQFAIVVKKALAHAEAQMVAIIDEAARGYKVIKIKKKYETRTDKSGKRVKVLVEEVYEETTRRDWQAAAWRLERKHADRWARTVRTEDSSLDVSDRVRAAQELLKEITTGLNHAQSSLKKSA